MSLVNVNVPNLLNGVSQQADPLRFVTQGKEQINGMSSVVNGLTKRNGTELTHKLSKLSVQDLNPFVHFINRDVNERYVVLMHKYPLADPTSPDGDVGQIRIWDLVTGEEKTVIGSIELDDFPLAGLEPRETYGEGSIESTGYGDISNTGVQGTDVYTYPTPQIPSLGSVYIGTNPKENIKAFTVADTTFFLNTSKTVELIPQDNVQSPIVPVTAGFFVVGKAYTIFATGTTNFTLIGASSNAVGTLFVATGVGTGNGTATEGFLQGKAASRSKTTVTVALGNENSFSGVYPQSFVTVGETLIASTTTTNSTAVTGPITVRSLFKTGSTWYFTYDCLDAGTIAWSIGSGGLSFSRGARPHPFYMPHSLVRQADGSFHFLRNYWNPRTVGTALSNPNPSFVGKTLNDMFMYRSRLGFLADENIVLSENSEFFNFFRTEMSTLLDSDPIDVSSSHSKVTVFNNAVPFSERLVLFSDEAQFYMTASDILTPKTASIQQTTEFSVDKNTKPIVVGKNIFFPFTRGQFSGVMEYFITQDTLEFNGIDITSPIPSYIDGKISKIVSSNNEQIVAITTEDTVNTLYIYKYFTTEDQKLQSSWSKWELGSGEKIIGMEFVDNYLYLVVDKSSAEASSGGTSEYYFKEQGVSLLRINIQDFYLDKNSDFFVKLDSKINETQLINSSYDTQTDETTFTLPYLPQLITGKTPVIVERAEQNRVSYTFDGTPANDAVVIPKGALDNQEYTIQTQGGLTSLEDVFYRGTETISLAGKGTRNSYTVGSPSTTGFGIEARIGFVKIGFQAYSVHWVVTQYKNYLPTSFFISEQKDYDLWTSLTTLPTDVATYPWEVEKWYKGFVDGPQVAYPGWELSNPLLKTLYPRRKETSFTSLPDTEVGKIIPVTAVSTIEINNFKHLTLKAKGNQLNKTLWFGLPFDFRYEFSNPMLRLGGGGNQRVAISDGRFQVKNGTITYSDSVAFNVEVTAPFRDKNTYKFSNLTTGRGDTIIDTMPIKSGAFRFPVLSRNDKELKIEVINDSPFPSSFISVDWEAFYSARSRRV
jgi:hypothetical protein